MALLLGFADDAVETFGAEPNVEVAPICLERADRRQNFKDYWKDRASFGFGAIANHCVRAAFPTRIGKGKPYC